MSYHYVRFRWWTPINVRKLGDTLTGKYTVDVTEYPTAEDEFGLYTDDRTELVVSADTVKAHLSMFRAVLSQKETKPFTAKDLELRETVIEKYPRDRPTPFPWQFSGEPSFEKEG